MRRQRYQDNSTDEYYAFANEEDLTRILRKQTRAYKEAIKEKERKEAKAKERDFIKPLEIEGSPTEYLINFLLAGNKLYARALQLAHVNPEVKYRVLNKLGRQYKINVGKENGYLYHYLGEERKDYNPLKYTQKRRGKENASYKQVIDLLNAKGWITVELVENELGLSRRALDAAVRKMAGNIEIEIIPKSKGKRIYKLKTNN